jgi:hypothetical protein
MLWYPQTHQPGMAFHLMYCIEWQAEELRIMMRERDGSVKMADPLTFRDHTPGEHNPPAIRMDDRESGRGFQSLFDALWFAGYRPAQPLRQDAIIEAKDSHLADLRKVLFSTLGVA